MAKRRKKGKRESNLVRNKISYRMSDLIDLVIKLFNQPNFRDGTQFSNMSPEEKLRQFD